MKTGEGTQPRGWRQLCAAALSLVFVLSAAMAGTLAWTDLAQHRTNSAAGIRHAGDLPGFLGLIITNTVENDDGSPLTPAQAALPFTYTIFFSTGDEYPLQIGEARSSICSGGGFQLCHGQSALIEGVPVGTVYTVLQTESNGYTVSSTNHHAKVPEGGIVVTFLNVIGRPPEPGPGKLVVRKLVAGAGDLQKTFTIDVTIDGERRTVTLAHGETRAFDLPFGAVYDVREREHAGYAGRVESGYGTGTGGTVTANITNTFRDGEQPTTTTTTTTTTTSTTTAPATTTESISTTDASTAKTTNTTASTYTSSASSTTTTSASSSPGAPKTGDARRSLPWFCVMILSALGLRWLFFWQPKKRRGEA